VRGAARSPPDGGYIPHRLRLARERDAFDCTPLRAEVGGSTVVGVLARRDPTPVGVPRSLTAALTFVAPSTDGAGGVGRLRLLRADTSGGLSTSPVGGPTALVLGSLFLFVTRPGRTAIGLRDVHGTTRQRRRVNMVSGFLASPPRADTKTGTRARPGGWRWVPSTRPPRCRTARGPR
jgi:hypothetical protein